MKKQSDNWNSDVHSYGLDADNRIIYLQEKEDETDSPGVDYRMAQTFVRNINILQSASEDPITIYMQTLGGCWYSGMGIYDAIKFSRCKSTIVGYSQICMYVLINKFRLIRFFEILFISLFFLNLLVIIFKILFINSINFKFQNENHLIKNNSNIYIIIVDGYGGQK